MRVLITRPQPDADLFAAMCRQAGLASVTAPLMTVQFRDNWRLNETAGALAFTSANGVRAFARANSRIDLPAFCVGAATAAAARESGLATIFEADGDVVSLAAVIAAKVRAFSGPVIHIAGARRAGDLIALLKQHGVKADRVVAYETEEAAALPAPAREAIEAEDNLSVAFFSPRTARLFLSLVAEANLTERLTRHRAACLSEPVAEIAGAANWAGIGVADNRASDAMIALLRMHA